jgi:hypothetical protein
MPNNLADISIFEQLQNNQDSNSVMSIFNTPQDVQKVKKACTEYTKAMDKVVEAINKAVEAEKDYQQTVIDITKDREKQSKTIDEAKDKKAKEVFKKEHNDILDTKLPIRTKERQLSDVCQNFANKHK